VLVASSVAAQLVLVLSSFLLASGMDDLSSLFLCVLDGDISGDVIVSATMTAVSVWNGAVGVMVLEGWLLWRLGRARRKLERLGVGVNTAGRGREEKEFGLRFPKVRYSS
jgi:hypothetical protein